MVLNKNIFLKRIFIGLISFSFFVGYFLRENASGGGLEFYNLSWPIINSFKKDFLYTINNYGTFNDGSFPLAHIINAYINPFSDNISSFQLSITFCSFVIFIILAMVLKRSFKNINYEDILLISSTLLLLPFFRTSAFWGKPENFSWLFCILSLYFFVGIKQKISQSPNNKTIFEIILFCFFSSCALYVRQPFIFLPISYLLYLFIFQADKKIIIYSIISLFILSIPGLILVLSWGGLYDTKNVDYFYELINIKFILKNVPILLSFFGFYLFPILIIEFLNKNYNYFFKKYFKAFFSSMIFFTVLHFFGLIDYLGKYTLGGGVVLKLSYLIKENNYFLLIIFSSIGFSILINLLRENFKNNFIFILPIFIIYCFPILLYQEYVEPLILLIFFILLKTGYHEIYFIKKGLSHFIFLSYFAIYLLGSIYFKHFMI